MATGMGFFQRLFSPASARVELLEELAVLAGHNQGLVERLKRHAALAGVEYQVGGRGARGSGSRARQEAQLDSRRSTTSGRNCRKPALHDGSNNWARLSGDLAVLAAIASDLRLNAMKWESIDEDIVGKLRQLAIEDDTHESELRKLAMMCDAMALD